MTNPMRVLGHSVRWLLGDYADVHISVVWDTELPSEGRVELTLGRATSLLPRAVIMMALLSGRPLRIANAHVSHSHGTHGTHDGGVDA